MSLLDSNPIYKPFKYPWAYDAWLMQQRAGGISEQSENAARASA